MTRFYAVLTLVLLLALVPSFASCSTIGEAMAAPAESPVNVTGTVTLIDPDGCYIESPDRSCGIWVQAVTEGIAVGDMVTVTGTPSAVNAEPAIVDAAILSAVPSVLPMPLGMSNRSVGGALPPAGSDPAVWDYVKRRVNDTWEWQWVRAGGASNTGLLVKTWGTVRSVYYSPVTDAHWFYLDDGAGCVSDYGDTGVLVYSDVDVKQGSYVSVTGISSVEPSFDSASRLVRVIRARGPDDVHVLKVPQPRRDYPFSDEFDKPTLDPRWIQHPGTGTLSLSAMPGWLQIEPEPSVYYEGMRQIMQRADMDWDLETKIRLQFTSAYTTNYYYKAIVALRSYISLPRNGVEDLYVAEFSGSQHDQFVRVANGPFVTAQGDTCYFRVRKRGTTVTGSLSFDGVTYLPEYSATYSNYSLVICLYAWCTTLPSPTEKLLVYVDYFRLTPAD